MGLDPKPEPFAKAAIISQLDWEGIYLQFQNDEMQPLYYTSWTPPSESVDQDRIRKMAKDVAYKLVKSNEGFISIEQIRLVFMELFSEYKNKLSPEFSSGIGMWGYKSVVKLVFLQKLVVAIDSRIIIYLMAQDRKAKEAKTAQENAEVKDTRVIKEDAWETAEVI